MEGYLYLTQNSGETPIALTATGDDWDVTFAQPADIVRVGFIVTAAFDSTANTVVAVDKRPTAGSDTGRGDGDIATINIPDDTAAGTVWTVEVNPSSIQVDAGEQIVFQVTTAASSAGSGIYFVEYQPRPLNTADERTAAQGSRTYNVTVES